MKSSPRARRHQDLAANGDGITLGPICQEMEKVETASLRSNPFFDKAEEKLPSKRKAPMLEDEPESKRMLQMKEKQGFEIVTENNSLLPNDMVYSISLRLPPRAIMRFRVVCKRWFHILTDSKFLVNHHLQQQPMPLLCYRESSARLMPSTIRIDTMDLNSFKSHPIFLFKDLPSAMGHSAAEFVIHASCDGMLLISHQRLLFLCNPTTRCWTRLPELGANHSKDFGVVGLFCSVGEYFALYRVKYKLDVSRREQPIRSGFSFFVHVLTSQSTKNDRHIGCPALSESLKNELETGAAMLGDNAPTMYNSGLHWRLSATQQIVVFNTVNETFRWMKPPLKNIGPWSPLIEINGKLSMGVFDQEMASLKIWSLVDYDAEAWLLKQKIGLVIPPQNLIKNEDEKLIVYLLSQGNGLLVQYLNYILCCTTNSEVKKIYHLQNYQGSLAHHSLKESLVQHKFLNLSADKIPGDNLLAPFFRTGFPYFKRLQKIKDDEAALILHHQPHQTPGPVILIDALKSIIQKVIVTGEKESGNAACRVKNYKKAIDHYSEAIKYSYAVLPQRAGAYLQMEKYDECIQDCDVAVEKGREDGGHRGVIARALAIKGYALVKLAKSLKEYDKAIEIVQEALTYSSEASIRSILDKAEKAKQELEKKFSDTEGNP
uniref:F-box domain-containing protein n=1 Tax=Oryza punctata TaxID=4537 RepID=A0A0E0L6E9_ORYPU